jgi:CBS domain-containing protein
MLRVADLIRGQNILSIPSTMSVLEAARFMTDHNIGAVPVISEGQLTGMFTERDLMRRVVSAGRSPASTLVSEVMTPRPRTVSPDDSVEECLFTMREYGFRHLPVCDGEQLAGMLSLRDLLMHAAVERRAEAS